MVHSTIMRVEIGNNIARISIPDIQSFLGTLRNIQGVKAAPSHETLVFVELDGTKSTQEIIDEIRRIYGEFISMTPIPTP